MSIYPLYRHDPVYIQTPKFSSKGLFDLMLGLSYRQDNLYFSLIERRDCKDHIGIYDTHNLKLIKVILKLI